jgi:RecD/TraA family predicted helicase
MLIGGGGVGKSFTTQAKISLMKKLGKSFALFAPTGRASKVLAGYTKEDASTIHRGLCFNPSTDPQWGYNERNKLPYDVVIIDEMSMTDIFLMKRLIEAIDFSRTKLLFIGDDFQIPSVGAGNVLYDLINSNVIPVTSLTKVFRFGIGGISTISTKTRYGETWIEDRNNINIFGEDKGYIYMPMQQNQIMPTVKNLYTKLMNSGILPEDILILSSYNIGDYGTEKINEMIQQVANKNYGSDMKFKCGDTTYYLDDMVIQTKNNYKAIVYNPESYNPFDEEIAIQTFISNGDIGKVVLIDKYFMVVQFDNEKIVYDREMALNLKLAYSISLYKAQGGSAKNIIMVTPKAHTFMMNSNLIYVGQTRAEQRCYHLGDPETINRALKKKANLTRNTYLLELLRKVNKI